MKFKVYGLPVTQGSKKGFVVGKRVNINGWTVDVIAHILRSLKWKKN